MNIIINLAEKESAINQLTLFRENNYVPFDVRIENSHIKELNDLTGMNLFTKTSLYVDSKTLHELMEPIGGIGSHHFHGLTPEDIYMSLSSIKNPRCVFIDKKERYAFISIELSHFDHPLMLIVEKNAGLQANANARINKVVTIYPKDHLDEFIANIDERKVLYKK